MTRRKPSEYNWSKLRFDETILTKHFTRQSSKNVQCIVVHHSTIVGDGSGSALTTMYNVWQSRPASAHYGVDGNLVRQYVWDKDYAWATGSTWGNRYGISIEHMNSTRGPGWRVSKKTWKTGARLAAQLHVHYGLGKPRAGKTLRKHSSFTSTACPGPYLGGRIWKKYVRETRRAYKQIKGSGYSGGIVASAKKIWNWDGINVPKHFGSKGNRNWRPKSVLTVLLRNTSVIENKSSGAYHDLPWFISDIEHTQDVMNRRSKGDSKKLDQILSALSGGQIDPKEISDAVTANLLEDLGPTVREAIENGRGASAGEIADTVVAEITNRLSEGQ